MRPASLKLYFVLMMFSYYDCGREVTKHTQKEEVNYIK